MLTIDSILNLSTCFAGQEYAAAGTVKQNYVNILLMLLRLRQACDHPLLVRGVDSNSLGKFSIEMAKQLPLEKQEFLLKCLEASLAICGICSVCGHLFVAFFSVVLVYGQNVCRTCGFIGILQYLIQG